MLVDVYDTYATAPDGSLMHFKISVPSGTTLDAVARLAHEYVGGDDPEIEMDRRNCQSRRINATYNSDVKRDLHRRGFSVNTIKPLREAG